MIKSAFTPVLALHRRKGTTPSQAVPGRSLSKDSVLCGNGNSVDVLCSEGKHVELQSRIEVFRERGENVFGVTETYGKEPYFVVYGEKSLAFIWESDEPLVAIKVYTFPDWIQSVALLDDRSMAVLFGCNLVVLYHINVSEDKKSFGVEEIHRVQSAHKAVLLYSLLTGATWQELRSIVGTVFGEILVSYPCRGSSVVHRLELHTGMIFGLRLRDDLLFSISDDRSLRMWCMKDYRQLDEAYVHAARPFAICDGANETVFTAGQDSSVCMWTTAGKKLCLLRTLQVGRGSIRSLIAFGDYLIFGSENGCIGSICLPNQPGVASYSCFQKQSSVRTFALCSQSVMFFLDDHGILSKNCDGLVTRISHLELPRFDTLLLSPCARFLAVSSAYTCFVISTDEESQSFCITMEQGERIVSCLWSSSDLFLFCSTGKLKRFGLEPPCAVTELDSYNVAPRNTVNAVLSCGNVVLVGTRKGKVVVFQNGMMVCEERGHGRESITDLVVYKESIFSVGRDGKICKWRLSCEAETKLSLVEHRAVSHLIAIEWPCKFFVFAEALFVGGFHGCDFLLLNYNTGHCVCQLNCGGGHRIWQLLLHNGDPEQTVPTSALFAFIKQGKIMSTDAHLYNLTVLSPNAHISNITSVCAFSEGDDSILTVTTGIDCCITVSHVFQKKYPVVSNRLRIHTSSIYALSCRDDYLMTAGGKSELFLWRKDGDSLRKCFATRLEGDCRLISVCLFGIAPARFLVSCSDGRLLMFGLDDGAKGISSTVDLHSFVSESNLFTKVFAAQHGRRTLAVATTTSGMLVCWPNANEPKSHHKSFVEKAGLSALDVTCCGDTLVAVVGSESGCITAVQYSTEEVPRLCSISWHGATCTDLSFYDCAASAEIFVISIAIDCRLGVFEYSRFSHQLKFCYAVTLEVADPAAMCLIPKNETGSLQVLVVGSCLQIVVLDDNPR